MGAGCAGRSERPVTAGGGAGARDRAVPGAARRAPPGGGWLDGPAPIYYYLGNSATLAPAGGGRRTGDGVKGFLIFIVAWVVITQFILPRLGLRPG